MSFHYTTKLRERFRKFSFYIIGRVQGKMVDIYSLSESFISYRVVEVKVIVANNILIILEK